LGYFRSWLILARMVPADAPGVLLDGRQGGIKGYEGALLDAGHGLPSMTIRVDCELLGGCFGDRTHYAAEQEISFYDFPSSGGAAITSKLMPNVYTGLLAGIAGKCTSSSKGTDARRWSVAPASRHDWQLSRDVHVGNVARWKQCLP
jgi:hypothetical protein